MSLKLDRAVRSMLAAIVLAGAAAGAYAHHSFAMFDTSKKNSVTGTVLKFEWANPHVWLWVVVDDGNGKTTTWGFEGSAPAEMSRTGGWTKRSVKPGDKVTVQFSPLKDGRPGGSFAGVTLGDGTKIGGNGPSGGGPGGPGAGGPGGPPPGGGGDPPPAQ
ncbi:MAG: DUF6152 family protein [Steroidobacteraceae bacterium]